jgi:hypothetical protein
MYAEVFIVNILMDIIKLLKQDWHPEVGGGAGVKVKLSLRFY